MPILTGPQACRAILEHYRERIPALPELVDAASASEAVLAAAAAASTSQHSPPIIIALTASCMQSDRDLAVESGHVDFISKPLSLSLLGQKLHQWAKTVTATMAGFSAAIENTAAITAASPAVAAASSPVNTTPTTVQNTTPDDAIMSPLVGSN